MTAFLPVDLREEYLSGRLEETFDLVVSYSSVEHSGLGRYGDALHPWGDLVTMAKAWCLTKPGGLAVITVPTAKMDSIVYNAHRCYGPILLSHLFSNWKIRFASESFNHMIPKCTHGWVHTNFIVEKLPAV